MVHALMPLPVPSLFAARGGAATASLTTPLWAFWLQVTANLLTATEMFVVLSASTSSGPAGKNAARPTGRRRRPP